MSDLYRQLLGQLTTTFGGKLDETNADAIAYAAAELYHREFEPRLWQEKSTHDLLDLFGVPRAGVFAPYSLTERVLIFQRRATQAEYVNRAHELLSALGVPRQDEEGTDQSLKWRLERFLESRGNSPATEEEDHVDGQTDGAEVSTSELDTDGDREAQAQDETAAVAGDGARGAAAGNPGTVRSQGAKRVAEADTGLAKTEPAVADTGLAEAEPAEKEELPGEAEPADTGPADTGLAEAEPVDTGLAEAEPAEKEELPGEAEGAEGADGKIATGEADAERADELEAKGEAEEAERNREKEEEDEAREAGVDVDLEPGAAPLVDAVKALEHAARVEAELAQQGVTAPAVAGAVDVERLASTLRSIQSEMAALRTLVDTLGIEIRERLDILHEEVLVAQGRLGPEAPPPTTVEPSPDTMRAADDVTRELPPVPLSTALPTTPDAAEAEPAEGVAKRASRRVLLVVLLVLLGLVIAGAIVAVGVFGWDQIRSQIAGS